MSDVFEKRDLTVNGRKYLIEFCYDRDHKEPWKEHDGHSVITEWISRDKLPGEIEVAQDYPKKRYCDFQATIAKAKKEGWGLGDQDLADLQVKLGRPPKAGEVTEYAVRKDMARMKGWLNDEWHWRGIWVCPYTEDGEDPLRSKAQSLWGIESDSGEEYFQEVIAELIEQIGA
ncbi:hypothetical protein Lumi_077 [Xylophilus phage Lumi]|nr:hypothetical protein Lumi_077 [Xylophilus phage Lumi]